MKFPLLRWLVVAGLALSLYAGALFLVEQQQIGRALTLLLSWPGLAAAALCLLSYLLRGQRWLGWMRQQGRDYPLPTGLRYYLAGYAFTPTPGNLGEAVRGLLPVRDPLPVGTSLAVFGAERMADLLALLLLALPMLGWWLMRVSPGWTVGLLMLGLLVVLVLSRRTARTALLQRLPWLAQAWTCLIRRPALWFGLTLSAWLLQGMAVMLMANALGGPPLPLWQASSMYALAMVGGALSMLPAGLGGTEALLLALLLSHAWTLDQALLLTVVVRLLTLWFAVVLGLACLFYSFAVRKDLRLGPAA